MPTMDEMVKAVKAHARKNYNEGGWDYVVEAFSDKELAEDIGDAKTVEEAIANVAEVVGIIDERRQEVQSEAF